MHGVVRKVDKEWLFLPSVNKLNRFFRFAVGQILSFFSAFKMGNALANHGVFMLRLRKGIEVGGRLAVVASASIDIVALLRRIPVIVAQVPFSDMRRFVAAFFQGLGNGDFFALHPVGIGRAKQALFWRADKIRRF